MSRLTLEQEAAQKRAQAKRLLDSSNDLLLVAEFLKSPAGALIEAGLEHDVATWERAQCWGSLDDEARVRQGRALHARDLLRYLRGAEEEAQRQRADAERLTALVEAAADQGRIPRV